MLINRNFHLRLEMYGTYFHHSQDGIRAPGSLNVTAAVLLVGVEYEPISHSNVIAVWGEMAEGAVQTVPDANVFTVCNCVSSVKWVLRVNACIAICCRVVMFFCRSLQL